MDTFHPFWTLFPKHSFQTFSTLKEFISVKCSDKRDANSTLLSSHVSIIPAVINIHRPTTINFVQKARNYRSFLGYIGVTEYENALSFLQDFQLRTKFPWNFCPPDQYFCEIGPL